MNRFLCVIPDYGKPTLRVIANLKTLGFPIEVVAPYNILLIEKLIPLFFFRKTFKRKLERRVNDWKQDFDNIKIVHAPLFTLFLRVLWDYFYKKDFFLYNSFKWVLEKNTIERITWSKYDVLYCFDTCALPYIIRGQQNGLKVILESRGSHIDHTLQLKEKLLKSTNSYNSYDHDYRLKPNLVWWYNKIRIEPVYADFILIYSNYQKEQFLNRGYPETKLLTVAIASKFKKQDRLVEYKKGDKLSFLYVGAITTLKGITFLLKAWERVVEMKAIDIDIELKLAGDIRKDINISNLPESIRYLGYLSHDALHRVYLQSHVLVFPTLNDSFGQVIQEAGSFNLPVITTKNCGASDLIQDGVNGFVVQDPFDIDELTKALLYFIKHPHMISEMSMNQSGQPIYDGESEILVLKEELASIGILP